MANTTGRNHLLKLGLIITIIGSTALPFAVHAEEEEQAKPEGTKFSYTFNDVSGNLVIINCDTPVGATAGSGFIGKMDGKTYIFTNQHVIMGAQHIRLVTVSGEQLKPTGIELSVTRDIARLELPDRPDALVISGNAGMGSEIAVFGNSEGEGVATELYGKVEGVGADLLEVSAEFVSGNSGSPVLNRDREVVGIASYVRFSRPSRMTENTRFENKDRRFCYRLTDVQWAPVNWKKYNESYGVTYLENEVLVKSLFEVINGLYEKPFGMVPTNCSDSGLKKWCESHNQVIARHSDQLRRDVGNSTEELTGFCKRKANSLDMKLGRKDLTGFLREEFEDFQYTYEYAAEAVHYFGSKLPGYGY